MKESEMLMFIMLELHIFFDSDMKNCITWLETKNSNLGGVRPIDMIKLGRTKKLYQFIKLQKGEL